MITEDYVSFETAKLLKKKGFKIPYDSFRGVYINGIFKRLNPGDGYGYNYGDEIVDVCSLQMAMKWLRENHGLFIHIDVNRETSCWLADIQDIKGDVSVYPVENEFPNYEEACEAAIRYCLDNLGK